MHRNRRHKTLWRESHYNLNTDLEEVHEFNVDDIATGSIINPVKIFEKSVELPLLLHLKSLSTNIVVSRNKNFLSETNKTTISWCIG